MTRETRETGLCLLYLAILLAVWVWLIVLPYARSTP